MSVGIRMKRRVVDKSADRRRNKRIVVVEGHGGGRKMEDSDGEVFASVEQLDHLSKMSLRSRSLRSNVKQRESEKRFSRGEENDSKLSGFRMRRSVVSKDSEKGMKSLSRVRKEWGKNVDFSKNGKSGDARFSRGEEDDSKLSRLRMRRSVVSKDSGREMKSLSRVRKEWGKNGDFSKNGKSGDNRFSRGEEDDSKLSRLRMRRSVVSKDSGKEMKSFSRVRKEWVKDVDFTKNGKSQKPTKAIPKVVDDDVSDCEHDGEGFYRRKERRLKTEAYTGKISLKRLKFDGELAENSSSCDVELEEFDKPVSRDGENQISEQKPIRRITRVLDKTGKKIRVQANPMVNGSTETSVSKKTTKRVIKIDPYDISNKRLDDGVPNIDIPVGKETVVSMNAQFRAIQPSAEILSFVEENLLGRRRLIELQNAGYNVKLSAPLDNIPFSATIDRDKIEDNVFRNKLEFFAAAKISSSFPAPTLPEIAFAGRSNVGKSSLLNTLTRQWGVVRTSDKPGLTQTINFFKLASKLCLVDLPGYGFAYAKEEVKESWEELVKEFVSTRVGLQRVCLLVDTKWGMKARDFELIELMERSRTPYQIVLTKTDIVFPIDVARRAMQIQENLKNNKSIVDPVMMVSSKSGAGFRTLRSVLAKIARFVKP